MLLMEHCHPLLLQQSTLSFLLLLLMLLLLPNLQICCCFCCSSLIASRAVLSSFFSFVCCFLTSKSGSALSLATQACLLLISPFFATFSFLLPSPLHFSFLFLPAFQVPCLSPLMPVHFTCNSLPLCLTLVLTCFLRLIIESN